MATPIPTNDASFTLGEVATITGGRLWGDATRQVRGVVTDSRRAQSSNLFVALRGELHDGHDYLAQVSKVGAAAVMQDGARSAELDGVEVPDTLVALGALGRAHRQRWAGTVVGITGSAGKTSTKELTAAALRGAGKRVRATLGNLNNRIGVPMTLLTLEDTDEVAVIEMGTSEQGEIAALAEMTKPDVGVVTLVSVAHTEGLGSLDDVRREKCALLDALGPKGIAIVAGDDPSLQGRSARTFGSHEDADARVLSWRLQGERTRCRIRLGETIHEPSLQLVGEAAARNASAALLVADVLGVDLHAATLGMADLSPVPGRMFPIDLDGVLVIDDTYNANPRSMELSLTTARQLADSREGRLVVVLGDMKELGSHSAAAHAQIRTLADSLADHAIYVGPEMAASGPALGDASEVNVGAVNAPDVVLVKGSRSMGLERVVNALSEVPA